MAELKLLEFSSTFVALLFCVMPIRMVACMKELWKGVCQGLDDLRPPGPPLRP